VDEKAFRKGRSCMTIVCDIEEGTVEHVARGRKTESLRSHFDRCSKQGLAGIRGVAMDMWGPYIQATLACVPDADAKIVVGRFHSLDDLSAALTLSWEDVRAPRYSIYGGDLADLAPAPPLPQQIACDILTNAGDVVVVGAGRWFVVVASCATLESSYGRDSFGVEHDVAALPGARGHRVAQRVQSPQRSPVTQHLRGSALLAPPQDVG
jgi:hypothetical protein